MPGLMLKLRLKFTSFVGGEEVLVSLEILEQDESLRYRELKIYHPQKHINWFSVESWNYPAPHSYGIYLRGTHPHHDHTIGEWELEGGREEYVRWLTLVLETLSVIGSVKGLAQCEEGQWDTFEVWERTQAP